MSKFWENIINAQINAEALEKEKAENEKNKKIIKTGAGVLVGLTSVFTCINVINKKEITKLTNDLAEKQKSLNDLATRMQAIEANYSKLN